MQNLVQHLRFLVYLVSLVSLVFLVEKIETLKRVQGDKERKNTELLQHRVQNDNVIIQYQESSIQNPASSAMTQ